MTHQHRPDYRDNPNYRAAMKEIRRRSLAMSDPGPIDVGAELEEDVASAPPARPRESGGEVGEPWT